MKLWIKYIAALVAGVALALLLSAASDTAVLDLIGEFVIRAACYLGIPLVTFSAVVAFSKLRASRALWITIKWVLIIAFIQVLLLSALGLLAASFIDIPRLSVTAGGVKERATLGVLDLLRSLVPYSAFKVFSDGECVLGAYFFALLLGAASSTDKVTFRPVVALSDSLSRLVYNINTIVTEFLPIGLVVLVAASVIHAQGAIATGSYNVLLIVIIANFLLVALILWPLIIRIVCNDSHPYRILYASITPLIASVASGNANFTLPIIMRHLKESLGVHRRINSVTSPLFSALCHGGSAFMLILCFTVIYKSYSNLAMTASDMERVAAISVGMSFCLGGGATTFTALCVLCQTYGAGLDSGYLLLDPVATLITSLALAIDTLTVIFGTYIVGVKTRYIEHRDIKKYI